MDFITRQNCTQYLKKLEKLKHFRQLNWVHPKFRQISRKFDRILAKKSTLKSRILAKTEDDKETGDDNTRSSNFRKMFSESPASELKPKLQSITD